MATGASPAAEPGGLAIPLSDDQCGQWQARIDAAKKAAEAKKKDWEGYVSAYMVKCQKASGEHEITVPLEFAYVELKKAQLAFQVPEVTCKAKRPEFTGAVLAYQGALNHELKEAGAFELLDTILTDVLICGVAGAKVGYYADIRTREVPVMELPKDVYGQDMPVNLQTGQPNQPQPKIDPLTQQPITKPEDYVAHECFYADRIAPENLLFPPEFAGGDYDRAAWLGHRFQIDLETAKRRYKLPDDFAPTASRPMETLSSEEQPEGRDSLTTKDVEGVEIFYQASVYATAPMVKDETGAQVPDPAWEPPRVGQYRRVVFVKNQTQPVVHEDDTGQYIDKADGKLKGRPGNPLHILTLRYLPGSSYPVSDVQAGRPSSEEISTIRTQQVRFRERVMPILGIDRNRADPKMKADLEAGSDVKIGKVLSTDGPPSEVVQTLTVPQFPRDSTALNDTARGDYDTSWALGRRQTGETVDTGEPVTAREIDAAEAATDTRLAREQIRVLRFWTKLAEKFGAYLQQFKDEPGFAEIVGNDGVMALRAWSRKGSTDGTVATIAGEFVYEARPDAALRLDINQERQQAIQMYTQLGNDPNVNRVELLKKIATLYNLDPSKVIVEQLPEKKPEPPKISWSFKGEDLDLVDGKTGQLNSRFPLVLAVAQQGGFQFPPEAMQNAVQIAQQLQMFLPAIGPQPGVPGQPQTAHPGATTPMAPLSKQVADRTTNGAPAMPGPAGVQ